MKQARLANLKILLLLLLLMFVACFKPVFAANGNTVEEPVRLPDNSEYHGQLKDGLLHGQGILRWKNGRVYKGEFKNGLMHGSGEYKSGNGEFYTGEFINGQPQGKGKATYIDGSSYEGEFKQGFKEGQGKANYSDGSYYKGEFAKGTLNGKGEFHDVSGDIYKGDFKNGSATGYVEVSYVTGNYYKGKMKNWRRHGKGKFQYANGGWYEGGFTDDLYHGQGKYVSKENTIYEGSFMQGEFTGIGTIQDKQQHYSGEVRNWQMQGYGTLTGIKGKKYMGYFKNNRFEGGGKYIYPNGNYYEGGFSKGRFQGKGTFYYKKAKGGKNKKVGFWDNGRYIGKSQPDDKTKTGDGTKQTKEEKYLVAETLLFRQPAMLAKAVKTIQPTDKNNPNMYVLTFAGYGRQKVFKNEALFAKQLFEDKFGAKGHAIALVNYPDTTDNIPIATITNMEYILDDMAKKMDYDNDILFLLLTSHGSRKHVLDVSLPGVPLQNLPAKKLAGILHSKKIKWKVIVVSACYSGGFIKELKDENTLVITASRYDHVSFGCSDEADFTYFGRAFLKQSLPREKTFVAAFKNAKALVTKWEKAEDYSNSEPQISMGKKIKQYLKHWRATLNPAALVEAR